MADLWNRFKNLFQKAEESSPSNPLIHEVIERNEEEVEEYNRWKNSLIKRRLIDWINNQYATFLVDPDNIDEAVDFLVTPSSNGFVIHFYQTNYNLKEITHLFDYLKERVLSLNYKPYISDVRTYNRPEWVESVQRHYLKPRLNLQNIEKLDQEYGNITIEMLLRDEKVTNLKFRANHYTDQKYHEPGEFKELMVELLA